MWIFNQFLIALDLASRLSRAKPNGRLCSWPPVESSQPRNGQSDKVLPMGTVT